MPRPASAVRHRVHLVLQVGVVASGLLLAVGLAVVLFGPGDVSGGLPTSVSAAARGVLRGDGLSLIALGLLVLMATPVMRVAVLAVSWSLEGDRRYAAIAFAVLAILTVSVALGVG